MKFLTNERGRGLSEQEQHAKNNEKKNILPDIQANSIKNLVKQIQVYVALYENCTIQSTLFLYKNH